MIYEKESTQDILRGNQGIKLNKGLRTQGRINNTLLLRMDLLMLRSWKYLISTMRGTLYPLSGTLWKYWRENTGGYVLQTVGQEVAQSWGLKDIYGC